MFRILCYSVVGCCAALLVLAAEARGQYGGYGSQNRYGSGRGAYGSTGQSRYQRSSLPSTGGYTGSATYNPGPQLSGTYPPAPRVRRPVISPYLNLSRPEGLIGGVPNYYSLVRPQTRAFDRYQQGVDTVRRNQQENDRRQQDLYQQQQRDYQSLLDKIDDQRNNPNGYGRGAANTPVRTQYRGSGLRSTGHATSFGIR